MSSGPFDPAVVEPLRGAVARFRALACFAQRNGKLIRSEEREIVYQQTPVGSDGRMRLAFYLLERPSSGWDLAGCDAATE